VRRGDYFPGLFELGVVAGGIWAVPWYADTRLLFYRRDLFEAAGWPRAPRTWAEWTRALGDVRRSHPGSHPILLPLSEWEVPVILAFQRGADLLRDGDRFGNFTSPAFRSAFEFYQGFFRDGLAPRRGAAEIGNLHQDFAAGTFACFVSGPWNLGELARRLPPELQERWDTAPLPAPEGAEAPGLSLAAGAGLVLVRASPRHAEAWRWIEFLSAPEQQAAFHAISGDLPARRSAWSDPRLADSPHAQAFRAQLDRVRPPPRIPEWERIASRISRHAEAVVRGSESVEAALASLDRETDLVLEKRRWLLEREALAGAP
jgi:multiple sugar transport system substrate-binding protein